MSLILLAINFRQSRWLMIGLRTVTLALQDLGHGNKLEAGAFGPPDRCKLIQRVDCR